MATVTRNLADSQARVHHPLAQVRGTIRLYVGLEGAALLVTLLALWFWIDLAFDYGLFAGLSFDWVQEISRPARAILLGGIFLGAVVLLRFRLLAHVIGDEVSTVLRTAFAIGPRRQSLPVWLRLPLLAVSVAAAGGIAYLLTEFLVSGPTGDRLTYILVAGMALAVTLLHELRGVPRRTAVPRWVIAPLAGLASAAGAFLGYYVGFQVAGVLGGVFGASLMAVFADLTAVVHVSLLALILGGRCYLIPVGLVGIGLYLTAWCAAGWLADTLRPTGSALFVALLLAGSVLAVVIKRLLHDFRDDALALILERRFPKVLGDRLITAVELTDPKAAAKLGYSEAMLLATVHDAAERVGSVPVREAFDWKRLWKAWGLALLLIIPVYIAAGLLFAVPGWVRGSEQTAMAGYGQLHEVSSLWVERNVLLMNTIWPRQAHLEVLDWPESGDLRVGKDQAAPSLRIRALKWVLADPGSREGWRALTWDDLATRPELLGQSVAADLIPAKWGTPRNPDLGWTIDEIHMRLERQETRTDPDVPADTLLTLGTVLDTLQSRANDPALRRVLRVLKVPGTVTISYRGATGGGEMTFQRQGDNEYSGQFIDLKESIRFSVRGEDYYTKTLTVTVVPTPSLMELVVDEHRPAYMFYRVAGGKNDVLKGKKQLVAGRQISLYGGDTSRIDPVAAGSDLVLTAKSDKDLVEVRIPPPRKGAAEVRAPVELLDDQRTFRVRFDAVRVTPERPLYDFYFEFKDTDGVTGQRHIVIKPAEDAVPDVDISAEVVRKTTQGYMVTPVARIPLRVKVTDDYGLDGLEFAATYSRIDKGAEGGARGLLALGALSLTPGGPGLELAAAARLADVAHEARAAAAKSEADIGVKRYPITPFSTHLAGQRREFWSMEQIDNNLKSRPPEFALTRFYELIASEHDPVREGEYFFNTERLGLKADETREIQPRYRLQLWVEALDNDIETGPHRGIAKEKISLLIVSENDLLAEIAKEEEGLYTKLVDRVNSLGEMLAKLERLKEDLTAATVKAEQFASMSTRLESDLMPSLEKGEGIVGEVHTDYRRILLELVINRVQQGMIDRVERQICDPLKESLEQEFPSTRQGLVELRKVVDGEGDVSAKAAASRKAADEARDRLNALIRKLTGVLDQMKQLADINAIIKILQQIEQQEVATGDTLKKMRKDAQKKLLEGLEGLK